MLAFNRRDRRDRREDILSARSACSAVISWLTADLTRSDRGAYLGYFGPYTVDAANGVVVHHVVGSSLTSWVGSDQVRYHAFTDDGRLTLSLKQGNRVTQMLTWARLP